MERMWAAWSGRKAQPNFGYRGLPLLTLWPAYVVQLPYYTVHDFNTDPAYLTLFANHRSADEDFYTSLGAGRDGRYGVGAGPTPEWCSGTTYMADRLGTKGGCRTFSAYSVAGYFPAAPQTVREALLALLAGGEVRQKHRASYRRQLRHELSHELSHEMRLELCS